MVTLSAFEQYVTQDLRDTNIKYSDMQNRFLVMSIEAISKRQRHATLPFLEFYTGFGYPPSRPP